VIDAVDLLGEGALVSLGQAYAWLGRRLRTSARELGHRVAEYLQGSSMNGIPPMHAWYLRHLPWLRDRRGGRLCLVVACGFCSYRARLPFALTKIDRHLREVHGPREERDPDWDSWWPSWWSRGDGDARGGT
jgi:hypothetical protein